jgi:hypothetical protein
MVAATDLKSVFRKEVRVRVPPPAPVFALSGYAWRSQKETIGRRLSGVAQRSGTGRELAHNICILCVGFENWRNLQSCKFP